MSCTMQHVVARGRLFVWVAFSLAFVFAQRCRAKNDESSAKTCLAADGRLDEEYWCTEGEGGFCYPFHHGCQSCGTDNFNTMPDDEPNAKKFCSSWGTNQGVNIGRVFGKGSCPQWYHCFEGPKGRCVNFYHGCEVCDTADFNKKHNTVGNAQDFCASWANNKGKAIGDVFGVGTCPGLYHCREGQEGRCFSFYHGCTNCQTESFNSMNATLEDARKFCGEWGNNNGLPIKDVFGVGSCPSLVV